MLKEPCSEDIGRYFREDSSLFGVLFTRRIVVVAAVGPVAASHASIARVACKTKAKWEFRKKIAHYTLNDAMGAE